MPYCTVQVAHHAGNGGWAVDDIAEVMTTTQKRGPDPVWEEEFTLLVQKDSIVEVRVYDGIVDAPIAAVGIPTRLIHRRAQPFTIHLLDPSGGDGVFRHGMMDCTGMDIEKACPHGALRVEAGVSWRGQKVSLSELVTEAHSEFLE